MKFGAALQAGLALAGVIGGILAALFTGTQRSTIALVRENNDDLSERVRIVEGMEKACKQRVEEQDGKIADQARAIEVLTEAVTRAAAVEALTTVVESLRAELATSTRTILDRIGQ